MFLKIRQNGSRATTMIGTQLKDLRKKRALTQIQLAKALHVATGTIGNWEVDARDPDFPMLLKIADFFNVSVDYLLGREDYFGNYYRRDLMQSDLSDNEQVLVESFRSLLPEMQEVVLNMIKDLRKTQDKV